MLLFVWRIDVVRVEILHGVDNRIAIDFEEA